MEKLDYIDKKIEEVNEGIDRYTDRVELYYWEETILGNLKQELELLKSIRHDLQSTGERQGVHNEQ